MYCVPLRYQYISCTSVECIAAEYGCRHARICCRNIKKGLSTFHAGKKQQSMLERQKFNCRGAFLNRRHSCWYWGDICICCLAARRLVPRDVTRNLCSSRESPLSRKHTRKAYSSLPQKYTTNEWKGAVSRRQTSLGREKTDRRARAQGQRLSPAGCAPGKVKGKQRTQQT